MRSPLFAAVALGLCAAATQASADGKSYFASHCAGCHSFAVRSGPAGPQLKGLLGRRIAGAPDYRYSHGLATKGGSWNAANLDAYLANPAAFAPGPKMYLRTASPADRAALIAYLSTVK